MAQNLLRHHQLLDPDTEQTLLRHHHQGHFPVMDLSYRFQLHHPVHLQLIYAQGMNANTAETWAMINRSMANLLVRAMPRDGIDTKKLNSKSRMT
jgi:hypothetical protein